MGHLSAEEKDRYCREASGLAPLLGIPDGYLPENQAALAVYFEAMHASGEIVVTDTARRLARDLLYPPVPWLLRPVVAPALWLARLPVIGWLPPAIREDYGLRWTRAHALALHALVPVIRVVVALLTAVLRYWPAARAAGKRARG